MYPLFVLILLALLLRGVSFEYRNQVDSERWRAFWDWMSFGGSVVPSFLWGVIMAKLIEGLPVGRDGDVQGGFAYLFTPFSLVGGVPTLLLIILHGANFLLLRLHTDTVLYRRVLVDGVDLLPGLLADPALVSSFEEGRLFGADWLAVLGTVPNEYLWYWYYSSDAVAAASRAGRTRGEVLLEQQDGFWSDQAADRQI